MRIQTLSIVVGSKACNAHCPFCVSKMTHDCGLMAPSAGVNWKRLYTAIKLARVEGVTTVMLTGKGEPTLWPELIDQYLKAIRDQFPMVELQTNGLALRKSDVERWVENGLTTVVLSITHWKNEGNRLIYMRGDKPYPSLAERVKLLHDLGLSVRLNCILLKGYVDTPVKVKGLVDFARKVEAEQLTLMPVNAPKDVCSHPEVAVWVKEHMVDARPISDMLEHDGYLLLELAHGARVYDYAGQNVCLSNCLSHEKYTDKSLMRNLIFFPDGHLRYDWEKSGAIIL